MPKYRNPTPAELDALRAFAKDHGRRWKQALRDHWYLARIWRPPGNDSTDQGALLHALRNDPRFGHEGLAAFRFPKPETNNFGTHTIKVTRHTAPAHWAPALINGDESSLDDSDIAAIARWRAFIAPAYVVSCEDESWFGYSEQLGLKCSMLEYIAHEIED